MEGVSQACSVDATTARCLVAGFDDAGFRSWPDRVGGREAIVARKSQFRWSWFATRLHVFVVVLPLPSITVEDAERLTVAAGDYAVDHKGGFPRGLQTGSVAIPVFLAGHVDEQVLRWVSQEPDYRFAAMRFPVVVDEGTGTLAFYRGRWKLGWAYRSYVTQLVETTVAKVVAAP